RRDGPPGEFSLLFNACAGPGISLTGEGAWGGGRAALHLELLGAAVTARENPEDRLARGHSRQDVPITASGLLGEQPLVEWNNVGKGSRQNGSVTLGYGLALRDGRAGPAAFCWAGPGCGVCLLRGASALGGRARSAASLHCLRAVGVAAGSNPRGLSQLSVNIQLRTGTDKGNLTV
ncbi:hypothetical protein IWW36_003466, partial [Coemansia brasiliensis]